VAKQPGSIWVEGVQLHYVASDGAEWYVQGDYWGSTAGQPGSVWVSSSDAYLYYSGADGLKYRVPLVYPHNDANAQKGLWVEGHFLSWAVNGGKFQAAFSHNDGGASGHVDSPHSDGHTDGTHGDSHGDGHTDGAHGDSHTDIAHGDSTQSHADGHSDSYLVGAPGPMHQDGTYKFWGDPPAYTAGTHTDIHYDNTNYTSETSHSDAHFDSADHVDGTHGDSHADGTHGDSHNDQAHVDSSHGDTHLDGGHADHTDGGTGGHIDQPIYVGP
jgi:hypothetical protein